MRRFFNLLFVLLLIFQCQIRTSLYGKVTRKVRALFKLGQPGGILIYRPDPTRKPPEMYSLIESFCLGARRLEVFGRRRPGHQLRRGWVTVLLDDDGDINAVDRIDPASALEQAEVDSRASSVAGDEDEEEDIVTKTEEDIKTEKELEESKAEDLRKGMEGLEGAVLWQREKWERDVRDACQVPPGGRVVVPSTNGERAEFC